MQVLPHLVLIWSVEVRKTQTSPRSGDKPTTYQNSLPFIYYFFFLQNKLEIRIPIISQATELLVLARSLVAVDLGAVEYVKKDPVLERQRHHTIVKVRGCKTYMNQAKTSSARMVV